MNEPYLKTSQIEDVVRGFENCITGKDEFRHADHLIVAVAYLMTDSTDEAVARMRESLLRFLDHHGINRQKYHETLTVFWVELTAAKLASRPELKSLLERCNYIRGELADKDLVKQFYSTELLASDKAREEFVEPDLKHWR